MTKTNNISCNPFGNEHEILKKTKVEENGSSFELKTSDQFHFISIDKGLLKNEPGRKMDYLALLCERKENLFIELKGRQNLDNACTQIFRTFIFLKPQLNSEFKNIAIIVQKEFNKNDLFSSGFKKLTMAFGTKNIII